MALNSKTIECNVCGKFATLQYDLLEGSIFRCFECDHCFSVIKASIGDEKYEPEYFERMHKNWFANPDTKLFDLILDEILKFKPDASILDAGCGKGAFLRHARKRSKSLNLTGLDLIENPKDTQNCIDYLKGDFFSMRFEKQFDVVVTMAVIEHIADIHTFVRRLKSLCQPGGLVIIHTVNDRSIIYAMSRVLYAIGFSMSLSRLYSKHHLNHFNYSSLEKLLNINGLKKQSLIRKNMPMAAVDIPPISAISRMIMKAGIGICFLLGTLTGRTFSQTVVYQVT